eukprot:GEMP01042168.1.p1 GENE.GEMP01042168.1~~GEMP01042168.1.p1  ORF type:complete len:333 (-),score=65.80 GEMP01042168.1:749-1747(-)
MSDSFAAKNWVIDEKNTFIHFRTARSTSEDMTFLGQKRASCPGKLASQNFLADAIRRRSRGITPVSLPEETGETGDVEQRSSAQWCAPLPEENGETEDSDSDEEDNEPSSDQWINFSVQWTADSQRRSSPPSEDPVHLSPLPKEYPVLSSPPPKENPVQSSPPPKEYPIPSIPPPKHYPVHLSPPHNDYATKASKAFGDYRSPWSITSCESHAYSGSMGDSPNTYPSYPIQLAPFARRLLPTTWSEASPVEGSPRAADQSSPEAQYAAHIAGKCRPCAFFHRTQGCQNANSCAFCHFCPPGELKRRRKDQASALKPGHYYNKPESVGYYRSS